MADEFQNVELPSVPAWLEEQHCIETLLNNVVTRLNKNPGAKPAYTLNDKTIPDLFVIGDAADLTWGLLKTLLHKPYVIFEYKENKKRNPLDPEYSYARLVFNPGAENLLRFWLNRPAAESELDAWKRCVDENKDNFPGDISRLRANKISVPGKNAQQIIYGFLEIRKYIKEVLSLRNLSARCFWQDSKFLDKKEDLLCELYPQLNVVLRPVLVNVYIPEKVEGIVFIENQDSYTQGVMGRPDSLKNMALVYSAGFALSAQRIRQREGASLHFHNKSFEKYKQHFADYWYEVSDAAWPINFQVYFWGDLDFSGMSILASLKKRFLSIEAWKPGYRPMLELLISGAGHSPELATKQEQGDVGTTGCDYADEKLLPVLREKMHFVDQEWLF